MRDMDRKIVPTVNTSGTVADKMGHGQPFGPIFGNAPTTRQRNADDMGYPPITQSAKPMTDKPEPS